MAPPPQTQQEKQQQTDYVPASGPGPTPFQERQQRTDFVPAGPGGPAPPARPSAGSIVASGAGPEGSVTFTVAAGPTPPTATPPGTGMTAIASKGGFQIVNKGQPPSTIEAGAANLYADIGTGFKDIFLAGAAAGTFVRTGGKSSTVTLTPDQEQRLGLVTSTASYLTPGAAVLKGIGSPGESVPSRLADIAVGVIPFVPIGEIGLGGLKATLAGRAAIGGAFGGGVSAAQGGSPGQIAESAAIGAALFDIGPIGGKFAGKLQTGLESSAAAGRYAEIAGTEKTFPGPNVANPAGEIVPGQYSNVVHEVSPSLYQRFAMRFTEGGQPPAPPVGGGTTTRLLGNEFIPISQASKGVEPAVELSGFLQDYERSFPTKGKGFFEGEPTPEPPTPSTPAPAVQPGYAGTPDIAFGPGGGRTVGQLGNRPLFGGEYGIKPIEEPPAYKGGPAGPGYKGGGFASGGAGFSEETSLKTPPGSAFSETQYRFSAFEKPSAEVAPPDFNVAVIAPPALGSASSSAVKTILPPISSSSYKTIFGSGQGQGVSQSQQQQQGSGLITSQQVGSGLQSYIQTTQQQQTTTQQTQPDVTTLRGLATPPVENAAFTPSLRPFSAGFAQPPSLPVERKGRKQTFGFREIKHPISNILTGGPIGIPRGFKMKRGKKR